MTSPDRSPELTPLEAAWDRYNALEQELYKQLEETGTVRIDTLRASSDAYQDYLCGGERPRVGGGILRLLGFRR